MKKPDEFKQSARHHHLDRRAATIAQQFFGDPDDMLRTDEVASWLLVSHQWVELGRLYGYGPKFTRLSPRMIRYRRGDVLVWLHERTHVCTSEYASKREVA